MEKNITLSPVKELKKAVVLVSNCCWKEDRGDLDENNIGRCPKCHEMATFIDENDEESFAE